MIKSEILNSLYEAWRLITSFNAEIYGIIGLSLAVTILSTCIAAIPGLSFGVLVGSSSFPGKKLLMRIVYTFMGMPPVVAGLVVYLTLSRKGPLGSMRLLFTPAAMVIAQILIVFPIITGLTVSAVKLKADDVKETCKGLGMGKFTTLRLLLHECRYPIISALLAAYGRAISEVGAV
ncbi:MAG: ABC transporter permease subunit, partial [Ruminiclostridium sp.]|nr:ABC transporter permease subunit [Ruminiclostridium sp.]